MSQRAARYRTGEEIRPGDRVTWAGRPGRVVFVLGRPDIPDDWADTSDWLGQSNASGFMLDVEGVGHVFETEPDEDLEFVDLRPSRAGGSY